MFTENKKLAQNNMKELATTKESMEDEAKSNKTNNNFDIIETSKIEKTDLEDALDQTGHGRYSYMVLFIACFTMVSTTTEVFGVGLITTSAQCEFSLDTYRKGIIQAAPMLGIVVSSHAWGYIADTRGRRRALLITLCGSSIVGLISSFVTHWIALTVSKFISVIFASGGTAIVYAYVVEMTPKSLRNMYTMLAATSLMLAQFIIPVLGFVTLRYDYKIPLFGGIVYSPWRFMCQVTALENLLAMLMFLMLVYESPKFYLSQGREKESLEVLRKIYASNTGKKPETYPVKSISMQEDTNKYKEATLLKSIWIQTAPLFQRKYIKNTIIIMYIAAVAFSTGPPLVIWLPHVGNAFLRASSDAVVEDTFCGRVVTELRRAHNATMTLGVCNNKIDDFVLYTMMSLGCFITAIGLISTNMVKLVGKKIMVIVLNTIAATACFVLNSIYGNLAMALFVCIGANAFVMGIVSAFAVEVYPTYLRSMAVCLTIMAGRGFSFIVITIVGVQIENNCNNFFYIFGAFIFSAVLVAFFLPGEPKKENPTNNTSDP